MIVERYYANDPAGWATNADVVRMIEEVRRARPISDLDIQQDTCTVREGAPEIRS